jgi:hypothetical protein
MFLVLVCHVRLGERIPKPLQQVTLGGGALGGSVVEPNGPGSDLIALEQPRDLSL